MKIYGLTGGIASGKSEVAKILSQEGIPVIDADAIGHAVLEPKGAGFQKVLGAFGDQILTGGRIDRAKLSARVFADATLRQALNSIVHPLIQNEVARECVVLAGRGHKLAVIEAALLGENGKKDPFLSGLILVTCPQETRLQRLLHNRGMTLEEAQGRIAAQALPESKLALCDHVIDNSGEIAATRERVLELAKELLAHD
ncbi:MAG: dephospho-CoA kinase [Candidatus Hydrogenedentales bacterium]|jgi:dephospho-CoA kinase